MGNRNIGKNRRKTQGTRHKTGGARQKTQDLRLKGHSLRLFACILFIIFFTSLYAYAGPDSESMPKVITQVFENSKLKEEINLVGATLKELVGEDPELSRLKQISLKTYSLKSPPEDAQIETVQNTYKESLGEGWQKILLRRDGNRTVMIYGQEKEGVREKMLIVLITPLEISEMVQVGEVELSALDKLRSSIKKAMPKLDEAQPLEGFFRTGMSPSQERKKSGGFAYEKTLSFSQEPDSTTKRLEEIVAELKEETPLETYLQLAERYEALRRFSEALLYYKTIIAKPDAPDWILLKAYNNAANMCQYLGRPEEALNYYKTVLGKFGDQTSVVVQTMAAIKALEKDIGSPADDKSRFGVPPEEIPGLTAKETIKLYQRVINNDPKSSDASSARFLMGETYRNLSGYPDIQIKEFGEAVKELPGSISYKYLAMAYRNAGKYQEALEHYKIIIGKYPDSPELKAAYMGAAECSEAMGKKDDAKNFYKYLTEKFKGDDRTGIEAEKSLVLLERGDSRPFLGLGFRFTGKTEGALIVTIFKNGPCNGVGIKPGDTLTAIDSKPTPNPRRVIEIIGREKNIGDKITLSVRRTRQMEGIMEIPVTLIAVPEKLER